MVARARAFSVRHAVAAMKLRFSTADVAAEVACLRSKVLGFRIANVYDVNSKVYLMKLSKSGGDEKETEKQVLVLESGSRFHTTKYTREKSPFPSNFALKLRKHIKTKRINAVDQLGLDRIVDFTIGSGPATHHLILELYSQGNVVLTDAEYKVLTLLRSHRDDAKDFALMANHPYPIDHYRRRAVYTLDDVRDSFEAGSGGTLKGVVGKLCAHGPQVVEHCLKLSDLDPKAKVDGRGALSDDRVETLVAHLNRVEDELTFANGAPKGHIIAKEGCTGGSGEAAIYESFEPVLMRDVPAARVQTFDTFDSAVDEYFSKIESQKEHVQQQQQQKQILGKLDRIKLDQEARAQGLRHQAEATNRMAELIEYNLEKVDEAIDAVNGALASGFDWIDLERMIESEGKAGNPVAKRIHSLQLAKNSITLLLMNELDADATSDGSGEGMAERVSVDLGMSAHANACSLYQKRKKHEVKESKTIEASDRAIKKAEKATTSQLKKVKPSSNLKVARKQYWFEKFNWFITSENYLAVCGRDAQQNEILVKRYLRKDDVYVHADVHGAASCILRNRTAGGRIPPMSLLQVGSFCVCHSQAWNSKFTTGAWWVYSSQVSKTAPTGEYLQTGSFMIRGKKNFLQPSQLLMGFTFLFRLDDISIESHAGERATKAALDEQDDPHEAGEPRGAAAAEAAAPESRDGEDGSGEEAEEEGGDDEESVPPLELDDESEKEESGDELDVLTTPYGVGRSVAAEAPPGQVSRASQGTGGSRHMSAHARRMLKKGQEPHSGEPAKGGDVQPSPKGAPGGGAAKAGPPPQPKHVRGKHGKKKKMKKYADQDDEDRELAMMLLGSAGKNKKHTKADKPSEPQNAMPSHGSKPATQDAAGTASDAPKPPRDWTANGGGASSRENEKGATDDPRRHEEGDANQEGEEVEGDATTDGDLSILNGLTALPKDDDILLFCLPMCAPYSAIQNCKYKVKLSPGTLRKGKAAKSALDLSIKSNKHDILPREYELLKSIPEMELVTAMISNCKLSMPGMSKIMQNAKKGKGKGGKSRRRK